MPTKAESCVPICVTLDHCREQRAALPLQFIAAAVAAKRNESVTLKSILTGNFNKNGWRITDTTQEIGPLYIIGPATLLLVHGDFPKKAIGPAQSRIGNSPVSVSYPAYNARRQKVISFPKGPSAALRGCQIAFSSPLTCDLAWLSHA